LLLVGRCDKKEGPYPEGLIRNTFDSPKKPNYQWSFSYLTGFTGSIGFSFLFLSFLLPAIASTGRLALLGRRAGSSEAGGEETEKEAPVK